MSSLFSLLGVGSYLECVFFTGAESWNLRFPDTAQVV